MTRGLFPERWRCRRRGCRRTSLTSGGFCSYHAEVSVPASLRDPDEKGGRVWLKTTDPAAMIFSRRNRIDSGTLDGWRTLPTGEARIVLLHDDGRARGAGAGGVPAAHPATGKTAAPKPPKPKARKEAIAPEHGEETTIFDFLADV